MVQAAQKFDFLPGDAKPTGAKLELPERGINATVDANFLTLTQEFNESAVDFLHFCESLSQLAKQLFRPVKITRNGFAFKFLRPFSDPNQMRKASILTLESDRDRNIAKAFNLTPDEQTLDRWYVSGSKEFHVVLQPVTFEPSGFLARNSGHRASKLERSSVDRRNKFRELVPEPLQHGLVLNLDLMETDPPEKERSLKDHLDELSTLAEIAKREMTSS